MNRQFGKMYLVVTVLLAFFAASAAHAAPMKAKKVNASGGTRTATYVITGAGDTVAVAASVSSGDEGWMTLIAPPTSVKLVKGKAKVKITYTVAAKTDAGSRDGSIFLKVGDLADAEIEKVVQAGVPCKLRLGANRASFQYFGGDSTLAVSAPPGCIVETTLGVGNGNSYGSVGISDTDDDWYSVGAGNTAGTYQVTVAPVVGNGRTGKIIFKTTDPSTGRTDKKVFTIVQKKRVTNTTVVFGDPTPITDAEQAAKAAASLIFVAKTAHEASEDIGDIGGEAVEKIMEKLSPVDVLSGVIQKSGMPVAISGVVDATPPAECVDGGTVTVSGRQWVFDKCREDGDELNGTFAISGTPDPVTGTLTGSIKFGNAIDAPFTITSYDDSYTTTEETTRLLLKLNVTNMKMDDIEDAMEGENFDFTANGQVDATSTEDGRIIKKLLDFKDFQVAYTDTGITNETMANGTSRYTILVDEVVVASRELAFDNVDVAVTETEGGETATVSGKYAIKSYPENSCTDGTFTIGSSTFSVDDDKVVGGTIVLNDIPITISPDGTGTATIGGTPVAIPEINSSCGQD